nr:hypothetical protein CFP56_33608 [Quercus suber]
MFLLLPLRLPAPWLFRFSVISQQGVSQLEPPRLGERASENRHCQQRDTMNRLTKQVRQAVIDRIFTTQDRMRWHPDSSTGIAPSRVLDAAIDRAGGSGSEEGLNGRSTSSSRAGTPPGSEDAESSEDGGVALC